MKITEQTPETASSERRNSSRVAFDALISVAEHCGDTLPADDDFRPVKALNLSQTGISFRTASWPLTSCLLVRLNQQTQPVHVTAQIIECRRVDLDTGSSVFEVRCEFADWL